MSVSFVGAGPGDPGLLTARGQRRLAEAQVLIFDAAVAPAQLDGVAESAERIRVGGEAAGVSPAEVAGLLIARARAGLAVVRLLWGDATDFGVEAAALADAGVAFEVVPGVSLAGAGAAYAGIPSSGEADGGACVIDGAGATALDGRPLGRRGGTLLIRVSEATVAAAVRGLLRGGRSPDTPAALIGAAATFRQRTVTGRLGGLLTEAARARLGGPALLIVGDAVALRARLAWLERRPLFGRRVLVTRPRAQAARFEALLESQGAEVVGLPTIRLTPPDDWRPLDEAIARLPSFAWVLFTSANGVLAFRERLAAAGRDARALAGVRLATIGPETAEALRRAGIEPDLVPPEYRAEGLAEALRPALEPESEVLLVRAAEAREVLPRELQAAGVRVTVAPAYRTVTAKEGADRVVALLEARAIDVITFTSSSTVRGFMALLAPEDVRRLLSGVVLAAIGPITAATIAEYGLEVLVMPREYTAPALAAALAAHFARSPALGR